MRAQPRPGKRARINLLCRMHACRWTLFVREKNSVVKAQRVRFVVLFYIIMFFFVRTTRATRLSHQSVFLSFFFFSIVEDRGQRGGGKASNNEWQRGNCGKKNFSSIFSTPSPALI